VIENDKALATLVLIFAPLSLISIGGGPSVFAEMQRQGKFLPVQS